MANQSNVGSMSDHSKWLKFMKQNDKNISKYAEELMKNDYPTVKSIYFDLTALKDTRLGTILCLANDRQKYIIQHLNEYNFKLDKKFLTTFPELPYTEEQLDLLWRDPEFSNDIFDLSPDTTISISLNDVLNTAHMLNDKVSYRGKVRVYINCYPLTITKNIQIYSKILQEYLTDRVDILLLSEDPKEVNSTIWTSSHFIFLDSLETHTTEDSSLYSPLYIRRELLNTNIFTPVEVAPKQIEKLKERGLDYTDPEQLQSLMKTTSDIMNMWCKFNYCLFSIPLENNL